MEVHSAKPGMAADAAFISAGGNRHPSAADCDPVSGLVAFGADSNVALWIPDDANRRGITALLKGHTGPVNAVKFLPLPEHGINLLLTGSVDKSIRIWKPHDTIVGSFIEALVLQQHQTAVNVIAVLPEAGIFVSASADTDLLVWSVKWLVEGSLEVKLVQQIALSPQYFPLALDIHRLHSTGCVVLAVAGTRPSVQVFVSPVPAIAFKCVATLTGHEAWIRSLSFTQDSDRQDSDLLLASASQDKYIRLWRIRQGTELPASDRPADGPILGSLKKSLSNKAHRFSAGDTSYSVTFEALLLGHEDWINSARWNRAADRLQLLTASADSSLSIWETDTESGVWVPTVRLGEISAQKGATTATGSAGGYWNGLWSPKGDFVISIGRTGSWRIWRCDEGLGIWEQDVGVTGHTRDVRSIAWSQDGSYLLSTSSDQTSRLFAECKWNGKCSWHELSRPQIHGYDLNCIDVLGSAHFISGADEKLLRVFDEPRTLADLLGNLTGRTHAEQRYLPDAASIPVLGLSNKAINSASEGPANADGEAATVEVEDLQKKALNGLPKVLPPLEDQLARHLLWPETEKLYGHGYEVCTVASAHDGSLVATACRASSIDHAVIRLYETKTWQEIKPPLKAHSLTVTALEFSRNDRYLLSIGRDRQCVIWERTEAETHHYVMVAADSKAHSRMALDASWAPTNGGERVFATAGRDKAVHLWTLEDNKSISRSDTVTLLTPVTAIAFYRDIVGNGFLLACGLENGSLLIVQYSAHDFSQYKQGPIFIENSLAPSKAIMDLAWRPVPTGYSEEAESFTHQQTLQLAVASEDTSLRILELHTRDLDQVT